MKSIQSTFSMPLLLAALLAGGGILAATAHAMPGGGPDGQPRCEARQGQDFQSRMQARHAQHMSALKEKLKLAPEQEAAWNTFAASMQPGMRQARYGRAGRARGIPATQHGGATGPDAGHGGSAPRQNVAAHRGGEGLWAEAALQEH